MLSKIKRTDSTSPATINNSAQLPKKGLIPSVIAQDMNILGNLITDGPVDFGGSLNGNVNCHTLTLRASGVITGEVHAETAHIYGRVKGIVRARNVHLYSTCHIEGVIMHEALSVEDGAFIDGNFKRTDKTPGPDSVLDNDGTNIDMLENLRLITA